MRIIFSVTKVTDFLAPELLSDHGADGQCGEMIDVKGMDYTFRGLAYSHRGSFFGEVPSGND